MTATSGDYLWLREAFPELSEAYCVTLVRGVTPDELLDRFGVTGDRESLYGVEALVEPSFAQWSVHEGDVLFVGAAAVGDWAVAVEVNGYLGVTAELLDRLSAGTRLVSHFRNVNALHRFCLVDDGEIRLDFDALFAWDRGGTDPDAYADLMRAAGLPMEKDGELGNPGAAAFALAEAITGVRLTAQLLARSTFVCGTASVG